MSKEVANGLATLMMVMTGDCRDVLVNLAFDRNKKNNLGLSTKRKRLVSDHVSSFKESGWVASLGAQIVGVYISHGMLLRPSLDNAVLCHRYVAGDRCIQVVHQILNPLGVPKAHAVATAPILCGCVRDDQRFKRSSLTA